MLRRTGLLIAAALLVPLSACSDGEVKEAKGDTAAKTVDNSETKLEDADVKKVVEALSSSDPEELKDALPLTTPGSVAEAYLKHQVNLTTAAIDGGTEYQAGTVKKVDGGYQDCDDASDKSTRVVFGGFESTEGKLATLTVDSTPLADRIASGDGSTKKAGDLAEVEFLSAYKTVTSGDLHVVISVTSAGDPININQYQAKYRGTDKRQSTATAGEGPTELAADSRANVAMVFKNADIGGEVTIQLLSEDYMTTETVTFKTR